MDEAEYVKMKMAEHMNTNMKMKEHMEDAQKTWKKDSFKMSLTTMALITFGVACVIVIIVLVVLGLTHVIFQKSSSASTGEEEESVEEKVPVDTPHPKPTTIEEAILTVPPYTPETIDYAMTQETPVVEHIKNQVRSEEFIPLNAEVAHLPHPPYPQHPPHLPLEKTNEILGEFIQHVMYVSDTVSPELEAQIAALHLPSTTTKERVSSIQRHEEVMGHFLSHVACLSKALSLHKNTLILDEHFRFQETGHELTEHVTTMRRYCENRWDVYILSMTEPTKQIYLDQGISKVEGVAAYSGYLVNKLYLPRLLSYWLQRVRHLLNSAQMTAAQIQEIRSSLQNGDVWLASHVAVTAPITGSLSNFVKHRVAICHIATNKYNQLVPAIQKDCYLKFLKLHTLTFFLFTDESTHYAATTEEGANVVVVPIISRGFPLDKKYRFHFIYQAHEALAEFDYIFYMDVDYHIYQHPAESLLLVPGIVATAHVHNLAGQHEVDAPESRPESTASISEHLTTRYAASFHGGAAAVYLQMCRSIKLNIDADDAQHITAKWGDESHLNKFLFQNPPFSVLTQSYIFSERCLNLQCEEPMCKALRDCRVAPIMGPN